MVGSDVLTMRTRGALPPIDSPFAQNNDGDVAPPATSRRYDVPVVLTAVNVALSVSILNSARVAGVAPTLRILKLPSDPNWALSG